MHGSRNVKFADAQQARQIYQYKNVKKILYETYSAMWYNKTWRQRKLTPNYISVKVNGNNWQCIKTIKAAAHHRVNQGRGDPL